MDFKFLTVPGAGLVTDLWILFGFVFEFTDLFVKRYLFIAAPVLPETGLVEVLFTLLCLGLAAGISEETSN